MNVGIYPGSFNPIHCGHLILANYIVEFTDVDELWFLVSPLNPFKAEQSLLDEDCRLEMVKIAVEDYERLKACDIEFKLPRPSYTITTLRALQEEYPDICFHLIIGADNWMSFYKWKDYEFIAENYSIKIFPRLGYSVDIPDKWADNIELIDSPILELSATFIRESIAIEKNVKAFLPNGLYEYILEKKLYKIKS